MNKKIILTALIATGVAAYFIKRRRASQRNNAGMQREPSKPNHHITDAFSKAKQYASSMG